MFARDQALQCPLVNGLRCLLVSKTNMFARDQTCLLVSKTMFAHDQMQLNVC
ncbi:unnamed protein product [Laminaria digitata]